MRPFSWQGQNLCGLSLVLVKDWRVVIHDCLRVWDMNFTRPLYVLEKWSKLSYVKAREKWRFKIGACLRPTNETYDVLVPADLFHGFHFLNQVFQVVVSVALFQHFHSARGPHFITFVSLTTFDSFKQARSLGNKQVTKKHIWRYPDVRYENYDARKWKFGPKFRRLF